MPCPVSISMNASLAKSALANAPVVCLDCETSGVHATLRLVGLSAFVPGGDRAFYLPTYSEIDPPASLVPEDVIRDIIAPILDTPSRTLIAHNAAFELMIFRRLGM